MPFIQWKGPFASTGFNDWKNPITIEQHENSQNHKNCVLILLQRQKAAGQVDALHVKEYKREVQYWREVLKRVVAAIKALASRGLSFRGSTEVFGSLHNGNYMMLLEFLAEFDPFLADHIEKHGNQGRGNVSYLSSSICEEIIQIMATEVLKSIDQEVTEAKYYSISVDSTPDITHTDQLAFITRYNKEDGKPVERFLGFIPNPGHKAEDLYNAVIKMMEEHNFNFANCRGQSYDNAANMSGIYNGLQAKIKEISPLAYWIPCAAHSLNLVGEHAAGSCKASRDFFSLLQDIYVFFSISTARWGILMKHLTGPSVKRLSTTRWSARYEACNSMNQNWKEVVAALSEIDERDRSKTGSGAKGLKIKLTSLETAIMFAVWSPILERFDKVSEAIQKVGIGIDEVVLNYESLVDYILGLRDQFDRFEKKRRSVLDLRNIEVKKEEPQQELFLLMKLEWDILL
ncbi:zinc finger MYM-type protein 1-like [Harmonia axyridis]|uniref:zinc finger MYM-type protein 1-like n=2 Tax=Harmonia axyridis TaxID=115357 RepID=UPI001E274E46|nr:zinc finger MYM-type protein 1-like [Harmonia axyridis]